MINNNQTLKAAQSVHDAEWDEQYERDEREERRIDALKDAEEAFEEGRRF